MTIYITKTWGFDSPSGPLQFSTSGWRDRARAELKPGDLVVIVGTMGEETAADERGKILGLVEPTTVVVSSLDFDLAHRANHFDQEGNYRWPFGLELARAWRFTEPRTVFADVSARPFGMASAQGIVPLLGHEADAILGLPREDVELLQPVRARARIVGQEVARRRAAPPPATRRTGVMHMRRAPAFTYAMAIEGASSAYKIGWAFDWRHRERQFNQAAMPELGGLRYRIAFEQLWDTAMDAFRMEQSILRTFDESRHASNREVVARVDRRSLERAWIAYLANQRRSRR